MNKEVKKLVEEVTAKVKEAKSNPLRVTCLICGVEYNYNLFTNTCPHFAIRRDL